MKLKWTLNYLETKHTFFEHPWKTIVLSRTATSARAIKRSVIANVAIETICSASRIKTWISNHIWYVQNINLKNYLLALKNWLRQEEQCSRNSNYWTQNAHQGNIIQHKRTGKTEFPRSKWITPKNTHSDSWSKVVEIYLTHFILHGFYSIIVDYNIRKSKKCNDCTLTFWLVTEPSHIIPSTITSIQQKISCNFGMNCRISRH